MTHDIAIVGGGPGGYVAAIRAGQLGRRVVLIEKGELGGLCLNWGCIPTKALLASAAMLNCVRGCGDMGVTVGEVSADWGKAVDRSRQVVKRLVTGVGSLMKKHGVEVIKGTASFTGPHTLGVEPDGQEVEASAVIIATGGAPKTLPGLEPDGECILTNYEALALRDLPHSWLMVGGGAIGIEFGYLFRAFGCEVTVVEALDRILPMEEEEVSQELRKTLERDGMRILTNSRITGLERTQGGVAATLATPQGDRQVEAERVLLAVGYRPYTEGLNLQVAGVETDAKGFVRVDGDMQTNVPGVYAVGDVAGQPLLAHAAFLRGEIAVEAIAGRPHARFVPANIPRATYSQPEAASIGLTEREAREQGMEVKVGRFPYRASGRALTAGHPTGFVKVVKEARYGQILGVHILGAEASELLGEATLAVALEETTEAVGAVTHAHPTLSEMIREAALAADDKAIHI